jgi:hypothetical protein
MAAAFSKTSLLLLLLLLAGLLFYFGQPKLIVTPETWSAPRGSRMKFEVVDHRWFFFRNNVTSEAIPLSHDSHVINFKRGTEGTALAEGNTKVTFHCGTRHTDVVVQVGPPRPPKYLTIEPENVQLAMNSTQRVTVIGHYDDEETLDLTADAKLTTENEEIAYVSDGRLFGVTTGTTSLTASYQATEDDATQSVETPVEVTDIPYEELLVSLDPGELAIGQTGELRVVGVAKDGKEYDLIGSKRLNIAVEPLDCVTQEDAYLRGTRPAEATLTATLGDLEASIDFRVADTGVAVFDVQPREVEVPAGSYIDLDVAGGAEEISTESSDDQIVTVESLSPFDYRLNAVQEGTARVVFRQGDQEQIVDVRVIANDIQSVRIEPAAITVHVGEETNIAVLGVKPDGTTVPLAPEQLDVLQQPRSEYVDFDRANMSVFGVSPTTLDDKLIVQYGDLPPAEAPLRVARRVAEVAVADDVWSMYPPIPPYGVGPVTGPVAIAGGDVIGDGLFYDDRGLYVGDTLPPGLVGTGIRPGDVIREIDGVDITGIRNRDLIEQYISGLDPRDGVVRIARGDGDLVDIALANARLIGFEDVQLNYVKDTTVTGSEFVAELNLQFRDAGQYRVTDAAGNPLSNWTAYDAQSAATIQTAPIPREPGKDRYRIYVERDIDGNIERFPLSIALQKGGE